MTISMAWVRSTGKKHELIFASDSRLSGGGHVDQCQKVFSLPREDCCIAFAGYTTIAYPFILQLQNVIEQHKRSFDREVDIVQVKARVLSLLNFFIRSHDGTLEEDFTGDLLGTKFLFGGWSWKEAKFHIWKIAYDKKLKRYIATRVGRSNHGRMDTGPIAVIGDYVPQFHAALKARTAQGAKQAEANGEPLKFDFEPLTVLSTMLSDPKFTSRSLDQPLGGRIGGAPQVAAVYPFLRTRHFAVEWDIGEKFVYSIKGRVIADFELFTNPGMDPFTGEVRAPVRGRASESPGGQAINWIA